MLKSEDEILARPSPKTGKAEHDDVLLEAPAADRPPPVDAQPEQEALAVAALYGLVGKMWAQAFDLKLKNDALKARYNALFKKKWAKVQAANAAEREAQAAAAAPSPAPAPAPVEA